MNDSCLIIAGEKSGEDHAMTFFPRLKEQLPGMTFFGVGGDKLRAMDVELLYTTKDFSSVGITEVLSKLRYYFKAMDHILEEVDKRKCRTAILIDFQGFNLKLSKKLKKRGVKVLYYVAPQAWVWKPWRATTLQKTVHTLFTILPFEKSWFQNRGVKNVKAVIHPLLIEHASALRKVSVKKFEDFQHRKIHLLLLPGSRKSEIGSLYPIFHQSVALLKEEGFDLEVGVVKVETVDDSFYSPSLLKVDHEWKAADLLEAIKWADLCFAASGTVTLATGLFALPTVVGYKLSLINEFILKLLIPYKGPASLTNIIHNEMIFPELIQYEADRYNFAKYARKWLKNEQFYNETVQKLITTKDKLSGDDFSVPDYMASVIKS
jgi:lipid-A-disaccharide synthase